MDSVLLVVFFFFCDLLCEAWRESIHVMNANGDKIYCFDRFAVSFAACHLLKIVLASQVGCRSIGALEYCLYVYTFDACWLRSVHISSSFTIYLWSFDVFGNYSNFKEQKWIIDRRKKRMNWNSVFRQRFWPNHNFRPTGTHSLMMIYAIVLPICRHRRSTSACRIFRPFRTWNFCYMRVAIAWMRFHREIRMEMGDGDWRCERG